MSYLNNCSCGSNDLKRLQPYGVESVQCQSCYVALRECDWNRVMTGAATKSAEPNVNQNIYDLVSINAEITTYPADHEYFLSFNSDEDCSIFTEWLEEVGFNEYLKYREVIKSV